VVVSLFLTQVMQNPIDPLICDTLIQNTWTGGQVGRWPNQTEWTDHFLSASGIDWYSQPGSLTLAGSFTKQLLDCSMTGITAFKPADIDSDGDPDLFILEGSNHRIGWLENLNWNQNWRYHEIDSPFYFPKSPAVSDFNNDGLIDLALISTEDGLALILQEEDGNWTINIIDRNFYGGADLTSHDLNGDGYDDLLGLSYSYNYLSWWENPGSDDREWQKHHMTDTRNHRVVRLEDFDCDGFEEAIVMPHAKVFSCSTDPTEAWSEDSLGSFHKGISRIAPLYQPGEDGGKYAFTGSILVTGHRGYGVIQEVEGLFLLEYDGENWTADTVCLDVSSYMPVGGPLCTGDVDGDGDQDICTVRYCFENASDGSAWIAHQYTGEASSTFTANQGNMSNFCVDLDGNGTDELIFVACKKLWFVDHIEAVSHGELISQIILPAEDPAWTDISWSAIEPEGTCVSLYVRASDWDMTYEEWNGPVIETGSLLDYVDPGADNFQYKVVLESDIPGVSPVFESISVGWR